MIELFDSKITITNEATVFGAQTSTCYSSYIISANLTYQFDEEVNKGILRNEKQHIRKNVYVDGTIVKRFKYTDLDTYLINNIKNGLTSFIVDFKANNMFYRVSGCKINRIAIGVRKPEYLQLEIQYKGIVNRSETPFALSYSPIEESGDTLTHLNVETPVISSDVTFTFENESELMFSYANTAFNHIITAPTKISVQDTQYVQNMDIIDDLFDNTSITYAYTVGSKTWTIRGNPLFQEPVIQPGNQDILRQVNIVDCRLIIT